MVKYVFTVLAILFYTVAFAIDNPPPPSTPTGAPPPPVGLPIDSWILPMVLLALVYGITRVLKVNSDRVS